MKLYIKQKVFSFRDRFTVYDEFGNDRFYVQGEVFTFGKKLHIYDLNGFEVAFVHEKALTFLPKYYININGIDIAEVVKQFTFFKQSYVVNGLNWKVSSNFWAMDYHIDSPNGIIANINKKMWSFGDTYEIDIANSADTVTALAVVLIIDACLEQQNNYN